MQQDYSLIKSGTLICLKNELQARNKMNQNSHNIGRWMIADASCESVVYLFDVTKYSEMFTNYIITSMKIA